MNKKKKKTLKSDIYAKKNLLKCIATKKIILSRVFIYFINMDVWIVHLD